jgi:hypothetical protein
VDDQNSYRAMMNDLASEETGAESRRWGFFEAVRDGMRRTFVGIGLMRPSFSEKVDAFRRGTAEERRCQRQAQRCVDGIERARLRLHRMARRLSEGGIPTTVKFWPISYKIGVNRKDRKFGFAELSGVIALSTRSANGRYVTSLPITVSSTRDHVTIQPSIATLQASGQTNAVVDLFLAITAVSGNDAERVFCDRFEDALAEAVAARRLAV